MKYQKKRFLLYVHKVLVLIQNRLILDILFEIIKKYLCLRYIEVHVCISSRNDNAERLFKKSSVNSVGKKANENVVNNIHICLSQY